MQKLIRFWQNLRLRAKFLLILLVGIVPVGIVAIVTLYIPLRAYDRQLYKKQRSDDFPVRRADSGRTDEL